MRNLIVLKNNEPVIDTRDMAKGFDMQHRSIMRLIDIHIKSINKFGKVRFEITPTESGQNQRHTYMNEAQATFIGTLMNNKGRAIEFKVELVTEFYRMKEYLQQHDTVRAIGKEIRKTLTDTINDSGENERMHGHGYSSYTRMVYDVTGLTPVFELYKGSMKARGMKVGDFRETLSPEELKRIELAESLIKPMLELDKQYSEIKDTLKPLFERKELK